MIGIPRGALALGLAGAIPFAWGVLTMWVPTLAEMTRSTFGTLGPRLLGPFIQLQYGVVILAFMSGVLWGFATKIDGPRATTGYALSVLPALWAFFMVGGGAVAAGTNLIVGFVGLLALDWYFAKWGLAPDWWMRLRILLTTLVILCLLPVVLL